MLKMFQAPFTLICTGATSSGKTQWIMRFLEHIDALVVPNAPSHSKILYCYSEINDKIISLQQKGIRIHNGVPDAETIKQYELCVLDDLMLNLSKDFLEMLFTRGSHNWGVSLIFVCQSLYGRDLKTVRANSHYLVLLRNPSGLLQVRTLGSQLFPRRLDYFMEAFADATARNYGYLVINNHPNADERMRLSTNVFPGENKIIYLPM